MSSQIDLSLKNTFNNVAKKYHEARPSYNADVFEKLIEVTKIDPKTANLLEIGSGTGRSTIFLAKKGYKIVGK